MTGVANGIMNRITRLGVLYLASFLEGLSLILFPASSTLFKALPYGITDEQYGLIFLPMITLAVAVTVGFKPLYRKWGAVRLFNAGLLSHLLFLAALGSAFAFKENPEWTFPLLAACNLFLGIGFGLLVAVMNLLCVEMFPDRRDSVLTGLHGALGLGAALSPLLVDGFYKAGSWLFSIYACGILALFCALLAFLTGASREDRLCLTDFSSGQKEPSASAASMPPGAVLFLITLFFYGIVEATLGNWTGIYLTQDKGFSLSTASMALSVFWLFMTVGRVSATFFSLRWDARILYRISPFVIALSLTGILLNKTESSTAVLYILAGSGCSYFFPLSISFSTRAFDRWREPLSSLTVASLMLGVGAGSSLTGFFRSRGILDLHQVFTGLIFCSLIVAALAHKLCALPTLDNRKSGVPR